MSLSNNYLSNLGNLGTTKCCDLKGLGPIGPVGPHGPIGPIGPDGTQGITGFIGPPGKLSTGGYSSYSISSYYMDSTDTYRYNSFSTLLNGIFESNKYYVFNMSFYLSGNISIPAPEEIDFNITFNISVEFANYSGTYYFSPSTFFINDAPLETYPIGMLLTPTNSGSTYSYSGTLNDYVYIDPTLYGIPAGTTILNIYINVRVNYQVTPYVYANFKWSSSVTPVN
jgi:hypothetical protein